MTQRIGKLSSEELDDIAKESYRQITANSNDNLVWMTSEEEEKRIREDERKQFKQHPDALAELKQGRKVITLCGSVKFWDEYREWNARLTLEGNIVFSCGISLKEGYEDILCDLPLDDVKQDLDAIHLCKINLSDEIFVLNVGGYIGDSTKREIAYAQSKGKRIKYLETLRQQQEARE